MAAAQKVWSKKGPFSDLGDLKKPFDRPEKRSTKFSKNFESPPLVEKTVDPPLVRSILNYFVFHSSRYQIKIFLNFFPISAGLNYKKNDILSNLFF